MSSADTSKGSADRAELERLRDMLDELQFAAGELLMLHGVNGSRDHRSVRRLERARDDAVALLRPQPQPQEASEGQEDDQ